MSHDPVVEVARLGRLAWPWQHVTWSFVFIFEPDCDSPESCRATASLMYDETIPKLGRRYGTQVRRTRARRARDTHRRHPLHT